MTGRGGATHSAYLDCSIDTGYSAEVTTMEPRMTICPSCCGEGEHCVDMLRRAHDLQLSPGRRLEAHARPRLGKQITR
jgi:hypothetical protein